MNLSVIRRSIQDTSSGENATHLAIEEECARNGTLSNHHSSVASFREDPAANTRQTQKTLFKNKHSSKSLNDAYDNLSSRRPSVVLQEILSTRRPSAIMASLRRGSHSILSPFRSKPEDPNDPAHSPEAVEYRRKNRRVGE
jgi:hypothetical protein